jgi:hypothetical protein
MGVNSRLLAMSVSVTIATLPKPRLEAACDMPLAPGGPRREETLETVISSACADTRA